MSPKRTAANDVQQLKSIATLAVQTAACGKRTFTKQWIGVVDLSTRVLVQKRTVPSGAVFGPPILPVRQLGERELTRVCAPGNPQKSPAWALPLRGAPADGREGNRGWCNKTKGRPSAKAASRLSPRARDGKAEGRPCDWELQKEPGRHQ